jgi:hypothetical protein
MSRRLVHALLFAVAAAAPFPVWAAASASLASVVAVEPARAADLVLLDAGFSAGLRQGMVCRVTRAGLEVAELLLVEIRPQHSAALIVGLAPRQAIRAGDAVHIKLLKS